MRMSPMCLLSAVLCTPAAHAAIYSVGGTGCTHPSVQAAVAAAAANAGGPHVIRLPESTFSAFAGVVVSNPQADITIGAATPTARRRRRRPAHARRSMPTTPRATSASPTPRRRRAG